MLKFVVLLGVFALCLGCKGEPLPEGDFAGFETAFNQRDPAAVAAIYSEDASLFPPNADAVVGRAAIEKMFEEFFKDELTIKGDYTETGSSGDLGYKSGSYTMTNTKGKEVDRGKFVEVWKRGPDGWEMYRDIFNSDLPAVPTPLSDTDIASIQANIENGGEALQEGDLATWGAGFTEDAVLMAPHQPAIEGRTAILAFGKTFPPMNAVSFGDIQIQGQDDMAVATSTVLSTIVVEDPATEGTVEGAEEAEAATADGESKQLVVLQRQTDGTWLNRFVAYNSDLPRPDTTADETK